jgi:sterol desaturase/sphingolipid hydroxylase (fatty acid hydroxylase superfamily)
MSTWVINHEVFIRLGFFFCIFMLMATWEFVAPRRILITSKAARWVSNLGIAFLDTLIVRLLLPMGAVSVAILAHDQGWGLLSYLDTPYGLAVGVSILVLDLVVYLQHVLFHAIPVLWRLHRVHHTDLDFDVTTGIRFHPIEIILSMGIKLVVICVLGPPVVTVLTFEVLLNATSLFNHSNIRIPLKFDRVLRFFVVTPDMHRVHHSIVWDETNRNFGFNLPWWDFLFGTYRHQPADGHEGMIIGTSEFRDANRLTLPWMLALPFMGKPGKYALSH